MKPETLILISGELGGNFLETRLVKSKKQSPEAQATRLLLDLEK